MYSNKENVNILTSQLAAYGVQHAVICPGSRNAPISHNLNEHPDIKCYPVTDERSAGFYAIGLCLATKSAVAVCVTSGSALLNVAPAIAEAYYQQLPIIVVSADRPAQWIGQQDGQTMVQTGVLNSIVGKSVNIIEPNNDEERWYCKRMISEAIITSTSGSGTPVHINVPISEPLFDFNTAQLPQSNKIDLVEPTTGKADTEGFCQQLTEAKRPLIIIGQASNQHFSEENIKKIGEKITILSEPLSPTYNNRCNFDLALATIDDENDYQPDFVLYVGNSVVSKRLKQFLRKNSSCRQWIVNAEGSIYDTFCHLSGIIKTHGADLLAHISDAFDGIQMQKEAQQYYEKWQKLLQNANNTLEQEKLSYSEKLAVRLFEEAIDKTNDTVSVHYANSLAVRYACNYARHHIYCNRGINGIEGSLSVACGFSLARKERVFCVIGDLSFFYDSNALWQQHLQGNLRILLLNNNGGGIFNSLVDLDKTNAGRRLIAAEHNTTAEGVCRQQNIEYLTANDTTSLDKQLHRLITEESETPILLEVFFK